MSWAAIGGAAISTAGSLMSKSSGGAKPPKWLRKATKGAVGRAETLSKRPYTAFTGERVAGLGENEIMAGDRARGFGAALQPLRDRVMGGFNAGALSQYENPYLDRVLTGRQRIIGEEFGRQSADLARRQTAMDAFRSGRSDLARSRLNESRLRALDDAEGEARHGAFQTALGAYQNQQQMDIGALGTMGENQLREIGVLGQTGATERGTRQAGMDFDYGQFLEGRDWEVNNFGILLDALRVAQGGQSGGGGQGGPSTAGLLTGLLGTAVSNGAFSGMFGGGNTGTGSNLRVGGGA